MTQDWFETLTGFREVSYENTRSQFVVADDRLVSRANGRSWGIGQFEMASLSDLRALASQCELHRGALRVSLVQDDVRQLHANPEYAGALFQVASQFNALEMTGPNVTPEDGVTRYAYDHTQGPACALAAAAATIYRNYFVPIGADAGQTAARQLDGLASVGQALSAALLRPVSDFWTMRNGYALCSGSGLRAISDWLATAKTEEIDALRGRLSIGLHRNIEVTLPTAQPGLRVSQAFCSALPVAYSNVPAREWRAFATLILESAYEATLLAAALEAAGGGSNIVMLTLLGGGAFGNEVDWIYAAIRRAIEGVQGIGLDIRLVSYASPSAEFKRFMGSL